VDGRPSPDGSPRRAVGDGSLRRRPAETVTLADGGRILFSSRGASLYRSWGPQRGCAGRPAVPASQPRRPSARRTALGGAVTVSGKRSAAV
jgi:hypothetical protein